MTIAERLACVALAALLPVAAAAQNAQVQFWLKGDPKNIQGCIAADPSFTREHTFLLVNGQAEIKSAGGINVKMKPVDRKSTRLNSSHLGISYAVFCLKKKN